MKKLAGHSAGGNWSVAAQSILKSLLNKSYVSRELGPPEVDPVGNDFGRWLYSITEEGRASLAPTGESKKTAAIPDGKFRFVTLSVRETGKEGAGRLTPEEAGVLRLMREWPDYRVPARLIFPEGAETPSVRLLIHSLVIGKQLAVPTMGWTPPGEEPEPGLQLGRGFSLTGKGRAELARYEKG